MFHLQAFSQQKRVLYKQKCLPICGYVTILNKNKRKVFFKKKRQKNSFDLIDFWMALVAQKTFAFETTLALCPHCRDNARSINPK